MQVVDLQNSKEFQALGVELLSIAPDPPDAWKGAAAEYGIDPATPLLSDIGNKTAVAYNVMRWRAASGEPGHTFILVDEDGRITWVRDYGAPEHGGVMYVVPEEIARQVAQKISS